MSVLMEFSMFPTDKGDSVSEHVSKIIEMVKDQGHPYKLTAMGTLVETESMDEALEIIQKAHQILEKNSSRSYTTMKIDFRKDKGNRLEGKIKSIEDKIGKVNN